MLGKVVQDALNEQIGHELYSSYLYLAMSSYCQSLNLMGSAHWMRLQAQEELGHAMKFFDFIVDRGGRVALGGIDQPPGEFGSLHDVFRQVLEHERKVTGTIHRLYDLAVQERDYATQVLLQWFVEEQVEEERSAEEVVGNLALIGDNPAAIFMLDRQLGSRQGG